MEIRRFGPGHRRPDGPPGTQGVSGQVIYSDDCAHITELAFQRYAIITPHSNNHATLFIVISGGGYVQVGEERARLNHGEAVVWPPGIVHGAYTDGTEMRAIVVELAGAGARSAALIDQRAAVSSQSSQATPAEGSLAERTVSRAEYDSSEGEPW